MASLTSSPQLVRKSQLMPVDEESIQMPTMSSEPESWQFSTPTKSKSAVKTPGEHRDQDATPSRMSLRKGLGKHEASPTTRIQTTAEYLPLSKQADRRGEGVSSPSTSLNANGASSASISFSSQASSESIFGALLSPTASTNPFLGMTSPKPAAELTRGAPISDYLDRRNSAYNNARNQPMQLCSSSTTIITSFGRRRPSQNRTLSSNSSSTSRSEQADTVSELDSGPRSKVNGVGERRCSDSTQVSNPSSAGTGITAPSLSLSAEEISHDKSPWPDGSATDDKDEGDDDAVKGSNDIDQQETVDDLTTWDRFKEGVPVEPPEAQTQGLSAVAWASENKANKGPRATYTSTMTSSYTSMTSSRWQPPRTQSKGTTIIAGQTDGSMLRTPSGFSMVPLSDDGRTFRFVEAKRMPSLSASSTGASRSEDYILSESSDCNPKTPRDTSSSNSQDMPAHKIVAPPSESDAQFLMPAFDDLSIHISSQSRNVATL